MLIKKYHLFFLTIMWSVLSFTAVKYGATMLPVPSDFADEDKEMITKVANLVVHGDSDDPHKYYYLPPFHVR